MAITFTKEPNGIYPAYNNSFIEFSSDIEEVSFRADITVYPILTFPRKFLIYANADGVFIFNLKEAVKVIFNENGFEDSNYFTDSYYKSIEGLYILQQIDIAVFNDENTEFDDTTKYYPFYKAVKQIGESIFDNPFQLLTYTNDGINHSLTYFEGFPFHFDIQLATIDKDIFVKSLNTGNETDPMVPTASNSFRINIDRGGGNNWTSDNFLPLIEGLNRLEIYEDSSFKSNLLLTKKKICSGIYLKWFNESSGFGHYLFDEFHISETKSKEIGGILNNEYNNIDESTGNYKSTGKEAEGTIIIKSRYESKDYEILKEIITSPLVQMYTSRTAYIEGRFIDVFIEGTISFSNKRSKNEINLVVELPETITAKL